ncbi:MAG: putative porin [Elusimicrobiota bacterium]|jgi:hypothetical protein|nr:putative porin [Elusimicrobiota bacterium]
MIKKVFVIMMIFMVFVFSHLFAGDGGWAEKLKFSGDYRLRYQTEDKGKATDNYYRSRYRTRFRLKGEANINDELSVNFGLATGSNDPRSTNQTLENVFEPKNINLDYVYAKYKFPIELNFIGGKFATKEVIWTPSDLLWDGDINLEGFGLRKNFDLEVVKLFLNAGYIVIDNFDRKETQNPSMFVIQPGAEVALNDKTKLKLGVSIYNFDNPDKELFNNTKGDGGKSNTLKDATHYQYTYNILSFGLELAFEETFLTIPKVAVFAEGVQNPDPDNKNVGFLSGLKFGSKSIKNFGDWEAVIMYRELQKDAWLDIFPDSDTLGGQTDNQGIKCSLTFGLTKNTTFGANYYHIGTVGNNDKKDLIQLDLGIKF